MFERPHHQRIATILDSLDPAVLDLNHCYFGGGTAIALRFGEYRESVDLDFLVSDLVGYRALRQNVSSVKGIASLAKKGRAIHQVREVRVDQYGLRTMLEVDGAEVKFEIVLEARLELERPTPSDSICGISTLTMVDLVATKLLANSDRWADDSVFSRDVIDLASMRPARTVMRHATQKAKLAYGASIDTDLKKAVARLKERPGRLDRCLEALKVITPKAVVLKQLKALTPRNK